MKRLKRNFPLLLIGGLLLLSVTFPIWGMGSAVFLDSERSVLSSEKSPDGKRIAQVERLVVGGMPNIIVMVRPSWMPDWYLAGCSAIRHYGDARASVKWTASDQIAVAHTDGSQFWWTSAAPFLGGSCHNLRVALLDSEG